MSIHGDTGPPNVPYKWLSCFVFLIICQASIRVLRKITFLNKLIWMNEWKEQKQKHFRYDILIILKNNMSFYLMKWLCAIIKKPLPTYSRIFHIKGLSSHIYQDAMVRGINRNMKVDDDISWQMSLMVSFVIISSHGKRANSCSSIKFYFLPQLG